MFIFVYEDSFALLENNKITNKLLKREFTIFKDYPCDVNMFSNILVCGVFELNDVKNSIFDFGLH